MKICVILLSGLLLAGCRTAESGFVMVSPSGELECRLWVDEEGQAGYRILSGGRTLVENGRLGLALKNGRKPFLGTLGLSGEETKQTAFRVFGVHDSAFVSWKEYTFSMAADTSARIEFRVFDQGVAYRYLVKGDQAFQVAGEASSWQLPENTGIWYFERDNHWKLKSYAGVWVKAPVDSMPVISSQGPVQGPPLVVEYPAGGFGVLTEAALYDYSGMRLEATGNRFFRANFTEGPDGFTVKGELKSPWRLFLFASDLNALVNQDIVAALNPAPDPALFGTQEFVRPGRSVWRWWSQGTGSPSEEREFVDYAESLGYEYTMIDAGWEEWAEKWRSLKELCGYAAPRKVGVFVWKHSEELNFPEEDYLRMRLWLDSVQAAGAAGIKVDFMNGETRQLIDFDIRLLQEAAKRKLLVDFHGCQKPSGESRTYPNELTREGVRGMELNGMKEGPLTAAHNAALPFTRMVAGPADYTPLGFTAPGPTTWAHQTATLITFYSPLQVIAEDAAFMLQSKLVKPALELIKAVPPVWDETRVLEGSSIGSLSAMARRKDSTWFVGILNGGGERDYSLDLGFLGQGDYRMVLVEDDPEAPGIPLAGLNRRSEVGVDTTAMPFRVRELKLKDGGEKEDRGKMRIRLAESGGFAAMFVPPGHSAGNLSE